MKKLTYHQKIELESRFKISRDLNERDRIRVVLSFDNGVSVEELAKILMLSQSAIRKYISDYDEKKKICNDPKGGSDFRLTIEESQMLNQHLADNTYLKVRHICKYVEETFHKKFSRSGMTAWLKQHHFVFKKPKSIPGKLNNELQEKFIEEYEELKRNLKAKEIILFGDAVHPQYQSKAVCGWIKKGVEKTLQTTAKQTRMHVVGAINISNLEVITQEYKTINKEAMIEFLKAIENHFFEASKIYLILDNATTGKNRLVDEYLKSSRIEIKYLPGYSPNLNPIERLWKIMREEKINNCYYSSEDAFFKEIRDFFVSLQNQISDWYSRLNDNFERIKFNTIYTAYG
jgi:transposase